MLIKKVRCACASDVSLVVLGRSPTLHFDPYIYANFVLLWKYLGRYIYYNSKLIKYYMFYLPKDK